MSPPFCIGRCFTAQHLGLIIAGVLSATGFKENFNTVDRSRISVCRGHIEQNGFGERVYVSDWTLATDQHLPFPFIFVCLCFSEPEVICLFFWNI